MSSTFFFLLLCSAINTAILLLAVDVDNLFTITTVSVIDGLVFVFVQTFFYCYLSEGVTSKLRSIGDIFYESAWYQLPVKQQQMVQLPILQSEREFRLMGLGIIDCSLWVFVSVSIKWTNIGCIFFIFLLSTSTDLSNSWLLLYFNAELQMSWQ